MSLGFSCRTRKSGEVEVLRDGSVLAATLRGGAAADFLARLAKAGSEAAEQQLMARVTGNYRRGNERLAAGLAKNRR